MEAIQRLLFGILDIDKTSLGVLSDLQLILVVYATLIDVSGPTMQQVIELVQVQLHHIALEPDREVVALFQPLPNAEHLHETSRHNTHVVVRSTHSIGLSRASLTICKYADVEAINSTLDQHFGVLEYFLLARLSTKAGVVNEFFLLVLALAARVRGLNLILLEHLLLSLNSNLQGELIDDGDGVDASHLRLVLVHRPDPTIDPDFSLHVLDDIVKPLSLESFCLVLCPQALILVVHLHILTPKCHQLTFGLLSYLFELALHIMVDGVQRLNLAFMLGLFVPELLNDLF